MFLEKYEANCLHERLIGKIEMANELNRRMMHVQIEGFIFFALCPANDNAPFCGTTHQLTNDIRYRDDLFTLEQQKSGCIVIADVTSRAVNLEYEQQIR
jgi:hypothetical protein